MDQRVKSTVVAVGGGVLMSIMALPLIFVLLLGSNGLCGGGDQPPAPSAAAANGIPGNYLALYRQAAREYGLDWSILAAIGFVETGHGSNTNTSSAGARGPMQFMPGTWAGYGVDGNHDGQKNILDPRDAIPGAANYLRASGAPGDYHRAIFAYNPAESYVQMVLAKAREYSQVRPTLVRVAAVAPLVRTTRAAAPRDSASPATSAAGVLNLGDSLAVGSGQPLAGLLSGRTVTSLAARNRTSSQGLAILRAVADVPATIVVQLGTNDANLPRFRRNVLSVLAIARRHSARVVWVNIARPEIDGTTDRELNAVLTNARATHTNLTIVDWHGAVASARVHLADNVHPGPDGYAVRAQLIAAEIGVGVAERSPTRAGRRAAATTRAAWRSVGETAAGRSRRAPTDRSRDGAGRRAHAGVHGVRRPHGDVLQRPARRHDGHAAFAVRRRNQAASPIIGRATPPTSAWSSTRAPTTARSATRSPPPRSWPPGCRATSRSRGLARAARRPSSSNGIRVQVIWKIDGRDRQPPRPRARRDGA